MPTTIYRSIDNSSRAAENVDISSVSGTGPYTVTLASAPTVAFVGDTLSDEAATPNTYFITAISGADLTVEDTESAGAPSAAGSSQATIDESYTTIAAWEAATDNALTTQDRVEIGVIVAAGNYNESITIAGATTDATRYRKLTVADGIWHAGTYSTSGIAYMLGNPTGRQIYIDENNFWLERFLISHVGQTPDASDEAIRVGERVSGVLVSRCIFRGDNVSNTDAVYLDNAAAVGAGSVSMTNCLIYDWGRGGVNCQYYASTHTTDWTVNVDHCTIQETGNDAGGDAGGIGVSVSNAATGDTPQLVFNVYNNVCTSPDTGDDYFESGVNLSKVSRTWNGSHNGSSDASLTALGLTTGAQESLVEANIFNTPASDVFTPKSGGALEDNGTNRQGSEADSRDDYSLDIAEAARGTTGVEIGCYAIAAGGGGAALAVGRGLTHSVLVGQRRLYN